MGNTPSLDTALWDLDLLRFSLDLPNKSLAEKRPPKHRPGDPFIKGPIPYAWIASASRLPGSGLHVAMAYRFLCCRFRPPNRWGLDKMASGLQISPQSTRRSLQAAEIAGLLSVDREPGCKLAVSVRVIHGPESGTDRRPLFGSIPWSWWLPASRLPGRALHVGADCWLLAGWVRSAALELALESWRDLGQRQLLFMIPRLIDEAMPWSWTRDVLQWVSPCPRPDTRLRVSSCATCKAPREPPCRRTLDGYSSLSGWRAGHLFAAAMLLSDRSRPAPPPLTATSRISSGPKSGRGNV